MKWEHIFAFAQDGTVLRYEGIPGSAPTGSPRLPMSVTHYISELGTNDGYEFAGSYHEHDGIVIVMKRQQAHM
jgi:hypothetical protein